jgi:predicted neuraminidase
MSKTLAPSSNKGLHVINWRENNPWLATVLVVLSSSMIISILIKMSPTSQTWSFAQHVQAQDDSTRTIFETLNVNPQGEKRFMHAASVVKIPEGIMAVWYSGTYEGSRDAEIASSRFDGKNWHGMSPIANSDSLEDEIGLHVKSVANPVVFRHENGELWLVFAVSRLSGWATCEILLKRSQDDGKTWSPATRLYASAFANISHLTKSPPVQMNSGLIGLPVYHEFLAKYPVFLVIDASGRVVDKRRMGEGGYVGFQPTIVTKNEKSAVAFFRRLRDNTASVMMTKTEDAGQTWSTAVPTNLPNPGGAVSAVRFGNDQILLAFNDDPEFENNITLAVSDLEGLSWRRIGIIANEASEQSEKYKLTYPYLLETQPGLFDLVFTKSPKSEYNKPKFRDQIERAIRHVRISNEWINSQLSKVQ